MHTQSMKWLPAVFALATLTQAGVAALDEEGPAARTRPPAELREPVEVEPLPRSLDLSVETEARTTPERPPVSEDEAFVAREARRAARWTARELVDRRGRVEYYRVGFHAALRAALADPTLGRWDLVQGERDGWRDPQARATGYELGEADAARAAAGEAERQVAEQFRDLSVTPRLRLGADLPVYHPQPAGGDAPGLRQVFSELPWIGFRPLAPRSSRYLSGWGYDGWRLYRCDDHREFYGASWSDASRALSFWLEDRRRAAVYRELRTEEQRERFRIVFHAELRRSLSRMFVTELRPAYELGFGDGWSYGAFVREEWNYRRGFHKGFREASSAAAAHAFERSYGRFYEASYRESFRQWSESARPEIRSVSIHDDDDDGIFEPGERVLVEYELINYGGAPGRFAIALDGRVLDAPGRVSVDLPRRDVVRQRGRLAARISELTPARTRTSLRFSMAGRSEDLPLLVSRPLEFAGRSMHTRRDDLNGEVTVEIAVANRSRRPRGGMVMLRTAALPGFESRRELDTVAAAAPAVVRFDLSGLEPLDLISGAVTLDLELESAGVRQDRFAHRLAGTARDLRNRDLIELLLRMSREPGTTSAELAAARELLMLRLEADWTAAVRSRGNPYKKDLKTRGSRTALGDLVQTYRREEKGSARPEVFGGLSSEIMTLARELPGPHPLLRKYVRRLARQLP